MDAHTKLDFTSLLDELIAASDAATDDVNGPAPSLRVDMLAQIERLQAENQTMFRESVVKEYGENAGPATEERFEPAPPNLQPALEDLFFLDPKSISRELGIQPQSKTEDLDKARRAFAMRYHPDRVPEEFRERAVLRMQIANMLIDEAKRGRR